MYERPSLARYAWLSLLAAVLTIGLKSVAYFLTGSVGLLSDALESTVNLIAAIVALVALTVAAREPDEEHAYGHEKAEYFASGTEGGLILLASAGITVAAVDRLLHPQPIEQTNLGLALSGLATLLNLGVAWQLRRAGRAYRSITLEADAQHLLTDVWTSVGVLVGVVAVALTGFAWLDPLIALAVGSNVLWAGARLIRRSLLGLLDTAIPAAEITTLQAVLARYRAQGIDFHAVRTRQAGTRRFVSLHVLVPGSWTISRGHELAERVEYDIRVVLPGATVFTHVEPREERASYEDLALDRPTATPTVSPRP